MNSGYLFSTSGPLAWKFYGTPLGFWIAFIVVALVMLAGLGALGREPWWKQSILVPQIQPLANQLQALIPGQWLAYLRSQPALTPASAVPTASKQER